MHKLKTYYITCANMGDALNELIFERIFGYRPIRHTPITCEISGIGSGLGKFCLADVLLLRTAERLFGRIFKKTFIWGTGFIEYRETDRPFFRNNMIFCAVRGELSKKRVEKLLGRTLDIPTGDGGILAAELLDQMPSKKHSIGIIPHLKEQEDKRFKELQQRFDDAIIIDVTHDPLEVIIQIASCEHIISSSLHGLIVADSFHIPNVHVKITDNLLGDGFKFDDYYSGMDVSHRQFNAEDIINVEFIRSNYHVSEEIVEKKKIDLKNAFPYS